ncbi:MAG TPA: hypothetical protein VNV87_10830 [Acidimicrobiales bacterium]|nr:hypothetical protein [Acidimicrobiales bacterium]
MPAMIVDTLFALLRLPRMRPDGSVLRPVGVVVTAHEHSDGVDISIRRPFAGQPLLAAADPFLPLSIADCQAGGSAPCR